MHPATLEQMGSAGQVVTVTNPTTHDLKVLAFHYGALKFQGHAILCDETLENDGVSVLRFTHFLTCQKCKEMGKWRKTESTAS